MRRILMILLVLPRVSAFPQRVVVNSLEQGLNLARQHNYELKQAQPSLLDERYPDEHLKVVHHQRPREEKKDLRNPHQILQVLRNDPLVSAQVFCNYGSLQLNGMPQGVDIMAEDQLFDLKSKMKDGQLERYVANYQTLEQGSTSSTHTSFIGPTASTSSKSTPATAFASTTTAR